MSFKSIAKIAMERWSKEDAEWVFNNSLNNSIEKKVAQWVLKKKFNLNNKTKMKIYGKKKQTW